MPVLIGGALHALIVAAGFLGRVHPAVKTKPAQILVGTTRVFLVGFNALADACITHLLRQDLTG